MTKLLDYAAEREQSALERWMLPEEPVKTPRFRDRTQTALDRYVDQRIDPISEQVPTKSAEPELPQWKLGSLASEYESRHDQTAIGYTRGMPEYGTYQISSAVGTAQSFMTWSRQNAPELYKRLQPYKDSIATKGGAFEREWVKASKEGLIGDSEYRFIVETHYDYVLSRLQDESLKNLIKGSPIMKDVVFSTATHLGGPRGTALIRDTYKPGMTRDQLVEAIYEARASRAVGHEYENGLMNRFRGESAKALAQLQHESTARDQVKVAAAPEVIKDSQPQRHNVAAPEETSNRESAWNTAKELLLMVTPQLQIAKNIAAPDYTADPDAVAQSRLQTLTYSPELEEVIESWDEGKLQGAVEEPDIPNPAEIFAGIFGGTRHILAKYGSKGASLLVRSLVESGVGTTTSAPVFILSSQVRERWGWGPALVLELSAGLGTAMTFDRFVVNKLVNLGGKLGASKNLNRLKEMPTKEQAEVVEQLDQVLRAALDRGNVIKPSVGKTTGREPMSWGEFLASNQYEIVPAPQMHPEHILQRRIIGPRHSKELAYAFDVPEAPAVIAARHRDTRSAVSQIMDLSPKTSDLRLHIADKYGLDPHSELILSTTGTAKGEPLINVDILKLPQKQRAKGVGTKIIRDLQEFAKEHNVGLQAHPRTELAGFYERMGFSRVVVAGTEHHRWFPADTLPMPLDYVRPSGFIRQLTEATSTDQVVKVIQSARANRAISELQPYTQKALTQGYLGTVRKGQRDPATKVDLRERELLIRQMAAKKNATKLTVEDEMQADMAQILGDMSPKTNAEVPPATRLTESQKAYIKAREEMDAFLEDDPSGFHRGMTKKKKPEPSDDAMDDALRFDEWTAYQEDLGIDQDATRSFGDMLEDMYTVFGHKIGLTTHDVTKGSPADALKAAERLARDLKFHRREALKQGVTVQQWYINQGLSPEIAQKLAAQSDAINTASPEKFMKVFEQLGEDVPAVRPELFDPDAGYGVALGSKLSVEYPFRRIGASESGFAFKTHASVQTAYEDQATSVIRSLYMGSKTNLRGMNAKQRADVMFKAEAETHDLSQYEPAMQRRIETAAKEIRRYLDHTFEQLRTDGILQRTFKENYIDRLSVRAMRLLEGRQKTTDAKSLREYDIKIKDLQERLAAVRNTEFVPLLLEWNDQLRHINKPLAERIVSILNQKQRQAPSLKWLAGLKNSKGEPYITADQIDPAAILGAYGRRVGKDIANQRLKNALTHDGLIRKIPRDKFGKPKPFSKKDPASEWPEIDANVMPFMKDHVAQPQLRRYLYEYYNTLGKHGWFENTLNATKMFQFFNPFILGMYNTYQSAMLHGVNSWRIPLALRGAIKDVMKNTKLYQEAVELGLSSKPYPNPLGSWQDALVNAQMPYKNRFMRWQNLLPHKAFKNYYNVAWDAAWTMDPILRMISYKELLRRGYAKRDAAQLSALFHGDYAAVPPQSRRLLNKFFFTPTFKIVMGQLHKQMMESAVKSAMQVGRGQLPGMKTRALAGGLAMLTAINVGRHMLMLHYGFESDQWGRRYVKEIEDADGVTKELVITMSDPTNLFIKYGHYVHESLFGRPSNKTWIGKLANDLRYEVHPFYRIILGELAHNRDWAGKPITADGQSPVKKALLQARYLFQQFLPVTKVYDYSPGDVEQRKLLDQHFGKINNRLLNIVAFSYVRGTEKERVKRDTELMQQRLKRAIADEMLTTEEVERAMKQIDDWARRVD